MPRTSRQRHKARAKTEEKRSERRAAKKNRMTGADVIFAELEAMSHAEQKNMANRLLDWISENELAP